MKLLYLKLSFFVFLVFFTSLNAYSIEINSYNLSCSYNFLYAGIKGTATEPGIEWINLFTADYFIHIAPFDIGLKLGLTGGTSTYNTVQSFNKQSFQDAKNVLIDVYGLDLRYRIIEIRNTFSFYAGISGGLGIISTLNSAASGSTAGTIMNAYNPEGSACIGATCTAMKDVALSLEFGYNYIGTMKYGIKQITSVYGKSTYAEASGTIQGFSAGVSLIFMQDNE